MKSRDLIIETLRDDDDPGRPVSRRNPVWWSLASGRKKNVEVEPAPARYFLGGWLRLTVGETSSLGSLPPCCFSRRFPRGPSPPCGNSECLAHGVLRSSSSSRSSTGHSMDESILHADFSSMSTPFLSRGLAVAGLPRV